MEYPRRASSTLGRSLFDPHAFLALPPPLPLPPFLLPPHSPSYAQLIMSHNARNTANSVEHSKPIPIAPHPGHGHARRGSDGFSDSSPSDSSSSSGDSPTSPLPSTPFTNGTAANPRIAPLSPSTSPILSYFLTSTSPKSPTTSFPFRRNFPPAVAEGSRLIPFHHPNRSSSHTNTKTCASISTLPIHPNPNLYLSRGLMLITSHILDDAEPDMMSSPSHHRRASMATWPGERGVAPTLPT
ncbi:hypothetical protein EIP91_005850, partial [Steccherinum ochraceum]